MREAEQEELHRPGPKSRSPMRDAATFAADLRDKPLKQQPGLAGHRFARDRVGLVETDRRSAEIGGTGALVVTPAALEGADMCREIRLARQEGKKLPPIKGPALSVSTSCRAGYCRLLLRSMAKKYLRQAPWLMWQTATGAARIPQSSRPPHA